MNVLEAIALGAGVVIVLRELDWQGLDADQDDPDGAAAARQAYVAGEIDERELERRLELALDEDAQEIRAITEEVNGIGPETSAAIALEFDSLEDLRAASVERLQEVSGVGPDRAADLREL